MTPETAGLLARAELDLEHGRKNLELGIPSIAGREAYLAMFHAAQALIFELTGKGAKTHQGVHRLFADLVRHRPALGNGLAASLSSAYDLKQDADYSVTPQMQEPRSRLAIAEAEAFVASVRRFIEVAHDT